MRYQSICEKYGDGWGTAAMHLPTPASIVLLVTGIIGPASALGLMLSGLFAYPVLRATEVRMQKKLMRERASTEEGGRRLRRAELAAMATSVTLCLSGGHAIDKAFNIQFQKRDSGSTPAVQTTKQSPGAEQRYPAVVRYNAPSAAGSR
jgi:hypothetical protein